MANIQKKVIRTWDGGQKTSVRDNNKLTSDGAQLVKHFDVFTDPNRLRPMPAWVDFATVAEKAYRIKAMGGFSDTVYGLGNALSNWYASSWLYRAKVTVSNSLYTASGMPLKINLASLPAGFWTHVNSDGSDIRVTNSSGDGIPHSLDNFNYAGHTGELWIPANLQIGQSDYVYVYYGNANAVAISDGTGANPILNQPKDSWNLSQMRWGFSFPTDVKNNYDNSELFTTIPTFVSGSFGKAVNTNAAPIATLPAKQVGFTGSHITNSFMIYLNALPTATKTILSDSNGTWSIKIDSTGHILWTATGDGGSDVYTSTPTLSTGQWYVIDCSFYNNYSIAINGVMASNGSVRGSYASSITNTTLRVDTASFCYIAQVWGFNSQLSQAQITTKYNNLTNASFWTYGSEESFASLNPVYGGIQIYTKLISSGNWTEFLSANQPVKSLAYSPVNGFIEVIGGELYFVISQQEDAGGLMFLAKTDGFQVLTPELVTLSTITASSKSRPTVDVPADKKAYFAYSNQNLALADDPGSNDIYSAFAEIISIVKWRNWLALGSTYRTRANVEIWDLVNANPLEFIDAGTGNLRILGNAQDILFAVIDNYIDDAVLSSNNPSMEIKQYIGNGQMDSIVKISIPSVYAGWTDDWERAVSFFKIRRNNETLFYAKLPANDDATEFNEGFWAIGKNSRGKLALTLEIDTSEFDPPENVFGFAQQVFFMEKDGGIHRLDTDGAYTKTSLYTTLKMNEGNTEIFKKLYGIEIITEPLDENQIVSVYYKKHGDTDRTKILELTGTGEVAMEKVTDDNDNNLDDYQEVEFDIESVNGKAAVIELNYKYEYTSDII